MVNPTEYIKNKVGNLGEQALDKLDHFRSALEEIEKENRENPDEDIELKADGSEDEEGIMADSEEKDTKLSAEEKRQRTLKNLEVKESTLEDMEQKKQTSMLHSQGVADHSGSSVHGAGKNLSGKTNASMWQRNFNNHEGN